jgi:hypothetical protein
MDFEWIKGLNCLRKQAWEGWLSLWWFWTLKLEHTNRGRRELLACRRRAPRGAIWRGGRPAWADRPGWPHASPWLGFLQRDDLLFLTFVPACSTSCTTQTLSSTPLLVPSTWCLCFESCPSSLASHATMNFLHNNACFPPVLALCMWSWWKSLKGHPMMHHGACMIYLTRLPASKHVLRLSTPLISKIKIISDLWESSSINLEKFLNH